MAKNENKSKILSLDTSSVKTGWSYFFDGKYIESGTIDLSKIKDLDVRIKTMILSIGEVIDKFEPNHVVIEDIVVERNWHTFKVLAIIVGAVYGLCVNKNISYSSLSPTQWRNIIDSGTKPRKRDELKIWGKDKVKMLINIDMNDDQADAVLIGYSYLKERED